MYFLLVSYIFIASIFRQHWLGGCSIWGMCGFRGSSSAAFIKRLVLERVPINLLHGLRYARHSPSTSAEKKYQITFFLGVNCYSMLILGVFGQLGRCCLLFIFSAAGSSKESHQTTALVGNKMWQGEKCIQVLGGVPKLQIYKGFNFIYNTYRISSFKQIKLISKVTNLLIFIKLL